MAGSNVSGNGRRVCVVGAGVCGLRTAELLLSKGFEVSILEARDRIGGRLYQSDKLGPLVDLGANWIHGTQDNPIVKLACTANTVMSACGSVYSIYDTNGTWLDSDDAKSLYDEVWNILHKAYKYSSENSNSIDPSAKMSDFFQATIGNETYNEETRTKLMNIVEMWGAFIGTEWDRQSLKFFWLDEGVDGDNLFLASTYKDVLAGISKAARVANCIRLNTEVVCILYASDGPEQREKVAVETATGHRETFDEIVLTTPLGWLKRNKAAFSPSLPPHLNEAINGIGIAHLDKVYIRFSKAFWIDPSETRNSNKLDRYPVETLFLVPDYASKTNPKRWRQEMVSLASLPPEAAHPTVMFYIYGEWGEYVTCKVGDMAQDSHDYYETLNTIFAPYYSRLPHFDPSSPDCIPQGFLSSDWRHDRFAGCGSYSNHTVGLENCTRGIETLRKGMGEDRGVWFAGEHTAPFNGLGTVTGAYWAGEHVAQQVVAKSANLASGPRVSDNEDFQDSMPRDSRALL